MRFWASFSKILGYIWLGLTGLTILMGIVGTWMEEGFSGVQALLSPFNVVGWLVIVITLAPGIGLLMLSEKLQSKVPAGKKREKGGTF